MSTKKTCFFCQGVLFCAQKVCCRCKKDQPVKHRLKKKLLCDRKKKHNVALIEDEAIIMLEKFHAIGCKPMLLLGKEIKKGQTKCDILTPRCRLSASAKDYLQKISSFYQCLCEGWTQESTDDNQVITLQLTARHPQEGTGNAERNSADQKKETHVTDVEEEESPASIDGQTERGNPVDRQLDQTDTLERHMEQVDGQGSGFGNTKRLLHKKQEQREFWVNVEGEQLCGQPESDIIAVIVKSEEDEEKLQCSELRWKQSENMKGEPATCTLAHLIRGKTPEDNSEEQAAKPHTDGEKTDSSQTGDDDDDDDDWQVPLTVSDSENEKRKRSRSHKVGDSRSNDGKKKTKPTPKSGDSLSCLDDENHSKVLHTQEKPYSCNVCGRCFTKIPNLKSHMRIHTGEKPFVCDMCGKSFSHKTNLNSHVRVHKAEKPFKCDVCSKCFKDPQTLKVHTRVHTGEKPYSCDMCSKRFSSKSYFKAHKRGHTGEKPFGCDICRKCFKDSQTLKLHTRVHTGEKPYSCDICSKPFTRKSYLEAHIRVHTGEKPYSCDICGQRFTHQPNLSAHVRIHSGEKSFVCNICGKGFRRKADRDRHKGIHRGGKPNGCDVSG
uniref:Zinc finger protein 62-like n=2 Tax=Gouania willdenowi TaxID=441366 RepID=A0A8C5D3P9_GOUWI